MINLQEITHFGEPNKHLKPFKIWTATTTSNSNFNNNNNDNNDENYNLKKSNNEFVVNWETLGTNNPRNFSKISKILILFCISFMNLLVVIYSTSYQSGIESMKIILNIENDFIITLGMSLYLYGIAIGPLLHAPLSEIYGRNKVYLISMTIFVLMFIPLIISNNLIIILISRFFSGFFGSSSISNGGATIQDLYNPENRNLAFNTFYVSPLLGPIIGPIYGSFVNSFLGWRWMISILALTSLFLLILMFFVMKETYTPYLLNKLSNNLNLKYNDTRFHSIYNNNYLIPSPLKTKSKSSYIISSLFLPLKLLFIEPLTIAFAIWVSIVYGIYYLAFTSYPIVFTQTYNWKPQYIGFSFLGIGIGIIIAFLLNPFTNKLYKSYPIMLPFSLSFSSPFHYKITRNIHKSTLVQKPPEARLVPCLFTSFLASVSLFWFAYTSNNKFHYLIPISSGILLGLSNTFTFIYSAAYLVDSYGIYSASALASNTFTRSIFGGTFPLLGIKLYHSLKSDKAGYILASISLFAASIPIIFFKWGFQIRKRSKLCSDINKIPD